MTFTINVMGLGRDSRVQPLYDSLTRELATTTTRADSLTLLSNIFDLAQSRNIHKADSLSQIVYRLAREEGDDRLALEMLRHRAGANRRNLSVLKELTDSAIVIETEHPMLTRETSTYLRMCVSTYFNSKASESERRERFANEFKQYTIAPPKDIYEKIVMLNSVCLSLAQNATDELLGEYTEKLGNLLNSLPGSQLVLRQNYYSQAASNYYSSGQPDKGYKADLKLMAVLDSLEVEYKFMKRPYHQFDHYRYLIYCRALSNYQNLSPENIDEYYRLAKKYRDRSPRVQQQPTLNLLTEMYYAISKKDYAKAGPYIETLLKERLNRATRIQVLRLGVECARATGNQTMLVECLTALNEALEQLLQTGLNSKVRELQILYDLDEIKQEVSSKSNDLIVMENDQEKLIFFGAIALTLIILLVFIVYAKNYRKNRRLASNLAEANAALSAESQRLMLTQGKLTRARDEARQANQLKSDFIRNISHELNEPLNAVVEYSRLIVDCTEASGKDYLSEYADLVNGNAMFLSVIFNDIFQFSEDNNEQFVILRRELTDINSLMKMAIDTVKVAGNDKVDIFIKPGTPDITTMVDPNRLMQILLNLLRNSVTHTPTGMIVLTCGLVNDGSKVAISVTDTGCGVDPDIVDRVFDRGVIGKNSHGGIGLGLPISLMLAHLMGGDLILDTSYKGGARFVLTFPYSIK